MTNKVPNPKNQKWRRALLSFWSLVLGHLLVIGPWSFCSLVGCDKTASAPAAPSSKITVASLVPAATDVIVNMGAGDHLVAVSNWDPKLPALASLPRAGDYRTVDWETIAQAKPSKMIVQFARAKCRPGWRIMPSR